MKINLNNFRNEYMNLRNETMVNMPYDGVICLDDDWNEVEEDSDISIYYDYSLDINWSEDYGLCDEYGNEIKEFQKIGQAILKQYGEEYMVDIIAAHNGFCLEDAIDLRYLIY